MLILMVIDKISKNPFAFNIHNLVRFRNSLSLFPNSVFLVNSTEIPFVFLPLSIVSSMQIVCCSVRMTLSVQTIHFLCHIHIASLPSLLLLFLFHFFHSAATLICSFDSLRYPLLSLSSVCLSYCRGRWRGRRRQIARGKKNRETAMLL